MGSPACTPRTFRTFLAFALILGLSASVACKSGPSDPSGQEVCTRWRALVAGAGGSLTSGEIEAGLTELGPIAGNASTAAIRIAGVRVAREGNAPALISHEANSGQAALAQACDATFPA